MSFFDSSAKKTSNEDIRNLFNKIGADSGSYQEIQQENVLGNAQRSWPIVKSVEQVRDAVPKRKFAGEAVSAPLFASSVEKPVLVAVQREAVVPKSASVEESAGRVPLFGSAITRSVEPAPTFEQAAQEATLQGVFSRIAKHDSVRPKGSAEHVPGSAQPVPVGLHSREDDLNVVFSRLAGASKPEAERQSVGGLRNMLGFLRK